MLPEDCILDLDPTVTLPSALLSAVTRGDVGFGKEEVIATCESRGSIAPHVAKTEIGRSTGCRFSCA